MSDMDNMFEFITKIFGTGNLPPTPCKFTTMEVFGVKVLK
jgi:hypothetical protein